MGGTVATAGVAGVGDIRADGVTALALLVVFGGVNVGIAGFVGVFEAVGDKVGEDVGDVVGLDFFVLCPRVGEP